jgi:hypothetical protein
MMSKLWCECLFALLIFYITLQHSFRRNSFVTKHINLHRYLSHGYSLFPVNHVNLNKKRFGYFHPISSLYSSDIDRRVEVYDLDQSSDSLNSSLNEMIDGIEVAELGLLLMVRLKCSTVYYCL